MNKFQNNSCFKYPVNLWSCGLAHFLFRFRGIKYMSNCVISFPLFSNLTKLFGWMISKMLLSNFSPKTLGKMCVLFRNLQQNCKIKTFEFRLGKDCFEICLGEWGYIPKCWNTSTFSLFYVKFHFETEEWSKDSTIIWHEGRQSGRMKKVITIPTYCRTFRWNQVWVKKYEIVSREKCK